MDLILNPSETQYPSVGLSPEEGLVFSSGDLVVSFSHDSTSLFSIILTLKVGALASIKEIKSGSSELKVEFTVAEVNTTSYSSNIGTIDILTLQLMLRVGIGSALEKLTSWLESNQLLIPAYEGILLRKSQIVFLKDIIILNTDVF